MPEITKPGGLFWWPWIFLVFILIFPIFIIVIPLINAMVNG